MELGSAGVLNDGNEASGPMKREVAYCIYIYICIAIVRRRADG